MKIEDALQFLKDYAISLKGSVEKGKTEQVTALKNVVETLNQLVGELEAENGAGAGGGAGGDGGGSGAGKEKGKEEKPEDQPAKVELKEFEALKTQWGEANKTIIELSETVKAFAQLKSDLDELKKAKDVLEGTVKGITEDVIKKLTEATEKISNSLKEVVDPEIAALKSRIEAIEAAGGKTSKQGKEDSKPNDSKGTGAKVFKGLIASAFKHTVQKEDEEEQK